MLEGKRGRLNLPSVQHANQGWRIYISVFHITSALTPIQHIGLYWPAKLASKFQWLQAWSNPKLWAPSFRPLAVVANGLRLRAILAEPCNFRLICPHVCGRIHFWGSVHFQEGVHIRGAHLLRSASPGRVHLRYEGPRDLHKPLGKEFVLMSWTGKRLPIYMKGRDLQKPPEASWKGICSTYMKGSETSRNSRSLLDRNLFYLYTCMKSPEIFWTGISSTYKAENSRRFQKPLGQEFVLPI